MPSEPTMRRDVWVQQVLSSQRSEQRESPWKAALEMEKKAKDDGMYDELVAGILSQKQDSPGPSGPQPPTH
ncbi:hypothetical protein AK830_g9768 [Neonectria ditissima]|uniref:Uncharacterized protein n=1 Tax=Neonectria ditissima TaxID=78410 RepID=A0A0N8H5Q1_9HYPO|nr:hypothetical protein AK830_g9768 [Neonectria ditissima]